MSSPGLFSDNSNAALFQCRISCNKDNFNYDIPVSIIYPIDEASAYKIRVFLKLSQSIFRFSVVMVSIDVKVNTNCTYIMANNEIPINAICSQSGVFCFSCYLV